MYRHCDRSGVERWIGSNVIDRIGWLIDAIRNDQRISPRGW